MSAVRDKVSSTTTSVQRPSALSYQQYHLPQRSSQYISSSLAAVHPHNTAQEPVKAKRRRPHLRIIVPSSSRSTPAPGPTATAADTSTKQPRRPLPIFTITPPTPITPLSPIHPSSPTDPPYTPRSYHDLACRAPSRARVPYLPRYCPHSLYALVSARASGCPLCTVQLLACDTWWWSSSARSGTLQAPRVLPAECTSTMRAVYYALGMPFGELDRSCVDWDVIKSIVFIPRAYRIGINNSKKPAVRESSRIRGLFRRARRVFSAPSREPMTPSISIAHGRFERRL